MSSSLKSSWKELKKSVSARRWRSTPPWKSPEKSSEESASSKSIDKAKPTPWSSSSPKRSIPIVFISTSPCTPPNSRSNLYI
ncbi:hypothetical protein MIMGU_mgv1a017322mg [Erythranthe guttata]|uniref:Uncharacterized protein n=1 Tax=Erythranthe guttata TaxID=4155 RepID=A0A022QIG5_ERYGU|nr:hypothetical protein MIMGU_mgv1a017322mg [Erythranthe guttata]